jgi:hypothetical protein
MKINRFPKHRFDAKKGQHGLFGYTPVLGLFDEVTLMFNL